MPYFGSYSQQMFNVQRNTFAAQRFSAPDLSGSRPPILASPVSTVSQGARYLTTTTIAPALALALSGCSGNPAVWANSVSGFAGQLLDPNYTLSAIRGTYERAFGCLRDHPVAFVTGFALLAALITVTEKYRDGYIEKAVDDADRKRRGRIPHLGTSIMVGALVLNGSEMLMHLDQPRHPSCQGPWGDVVVGGAFILANQVLEKALEKAQARKRAGDSRPSLSPEAIQRMRWVLWVTCLFDDVAMPFLYGIRQVHP